MSFSKNNKISEIDTNKKKKYNESADLTHLPFVERFRPKTLDGIMSHHETIHILKKFITNHNIPHLLFYGPPGTGKTSTIEAFINELYGEDNVDFITMKINASEERGIEIVRNKIKNFVSTISIKIVNSDTPKYKFIVLDEADAMTFDAQGMLKQVIEYYTDNARFCLICNCNKKINPAIQSRCAVFNFPPLDFESVKKKILMIADEFNLTVTSDGIETIWKLSNGDMRKKYPTQAEIDKIYEIFMRGQLKPSLEYFKTLMKMKYYSLIDVLTELTHKVIGSIMKGEIDSERGSELLLNMRNIEMNIIVTTNVDIQLTCLDIKSGKGR